MIIKAEDHMVSDYRFTKWLKVIKTQDDIDLGQKNGYALRANFLTWNEAVVLKEGEYAVLACERGSRKSHKYRYKVLVNKEEQAKEVTEEEIEMELKKSSLDESILCKSLNSKLYQIAAYCYLILSQPRQ